MRQIAATRDLLTNLDTKHPDILRAEGIVPADYHGSMVFRAAVESIRGTFAATTSPRAQFACSARYRGSKLRALVQPGLTFTSDAL